MTPFLGEVGIDTLPEPPSCCRQRSPSFLKISLMRLRHGDAFSTLR